MTKKTEHDLSAIITRIDTGRHGYLEQTLKGLKKDAGLKVKKLSADRTEVTMAGITARAVGGELAALDNWSNAARRAMTQQQA
ncbi:hypothetical protein [Roseobacter sp. N2S]|uniref:hypothetical protein n=1 Tax=Roseobacter sp. N2S TaxID=2663844 RepID=UPI00286327DB|nr:hypothetical protein [Roseobacter sp. N2S]MDR6266548.1 hypothetical protein [Roseobacter sp. N2S]